MAALNKVFLLGNLTRDPELRYTSGGTAICRFGLAVNRRFATARGEEREETCFVDIDVWGKQAESCGNFLRRGAPALIEGRLQFDQWDDRETGQKRSKLRVHAERVQFLGSSSGGSFGDDGGEREIDDGFGPHEEAPRSRRAASYSSGGQQEPPPFQTPTDDDDVPDDIPF